jgi:hypothetical protein
MKICVTIQTVPSKIDRHFGSSYSMIILLTSSIRWGRVILLTSLIFIDNAVANGAKTKIPRTLHR